MRLVDNHSSAVAALVADTDLPPHVYSEVLSAKEDVPMYLRGVRRFLDTDIDSAEREEEYGLALRCIGMAGDKLNRLYQMARDL
jgi:hypothetical protein